MDGHLSVESTVGSGSTFTVDLPHAGAALPLLCLPEGKLDHLEPASHEPIYTVLCIEDNPSNLRLLEVIFTRRPQVRLLAAIQGSIGVELARTHQPDLILLDLHLPDLHGHVVLSQLQNSPLTHAIPVLIISADATQNQIDRLLNAGAKAYLTKPLNVVEVLRTVDEFLPMLRLEPVSAVEAKFTA